MSDEVKLLAGGRDDDKNTALMDRKGVPLRLVLLMAVVVGLEALVACGEPRNQEATSIPPPPIYVNQYRAHCCA